MEVIDHEHQPLEEWCAGVMTRMRVSAITGAGQLCLFEQFCEPGKGAPTHLHTVEEVLTVLDGKAEIWVGDERTTLTTGQSMVVPAGRLPTKRLTRSAVEHSRYRRKVVWAMGAELCPLWKTLP